MKSPLLATLVGLMLVGCGDTPEPKPRSEESSASSDAGLSKGAALVLTLKGGVSVMNSSSVKGTAATVNQFLSPGDSLVTGQGSDALLLLTNGTTLSVGANTTFELKAFYQDDFNAGKAKVGSLEEEASSSTVLIDLNVGDLVVDVKKLRKKSNFEISTPLGVAGIRGTSFRLLASPKSTALSVLTGRVDFVSPAEKSFQVEANQGILAPKGEDPKVSHLTDAEKQAIQGAVDKAREKADEVELVNLKDGLGFKNHIVPSAANLVMIWVEPGTFMLGSPASEIEVGRTKADTQHQVTLTQGFYLGKHEVTQAQWERVMGNNPSKFKGGNRPVEMVSWKEAVEFCKKLTEMEKEAKRVPEGMAYQLPTEAQWEYACRAGTTTAYSWGDTITKTNANYSDSGLKQTCDVGQYPANQWGFHDMHGNVYEWCADKYHDYPGGAARDPVGPSGGLRRVKRGGSWNRTADIARCAFRTGSFPAYSFDILGFRLSLRPVSK